MQAFEPLWLPFDHPLWIVYSSGTTGLPKPIVHGHGGTVIVALALKARARAQAPRQPSTRAVLLKDGFDSSWFENGQYRLSES